MNWLFDTISFRTRDTCGDWGDILPIINQSANLLIALSYILTCIFLLGLWNKRKKIYPAAYMLVWFGIFTLLCGITHICDFFAFSWPAYRFFTLMLIFAAIASVGTTVQFPGVIKYLLTLPTLKEYQDALKAEREAKQQSLTMSQQLQFHLNEKKMEIGILETQLASLRGGKDTQEVLDNLITELSVINEKYKSR